MSCFVEEEQREKERESSEAADDSNSGMDPSTNGWTNGNYNIYLLMYWVFIHNLAYNYKIYYILFIKNIY